MRTGRLETSRAETPRAEETGKSRDLGHSDGRCVSSANERSQREYDFTMRKDRVSSWMEMPQDPAVSERMQGNANGHKGKNNKPKIC